MLVSNLVITDDDDNIIGNVTGLRLISFLDPTSIGGVSFNEKLFDGLARKTTGSHAGIYNGLYYGSVYNNTFEEFLPL